MNTDNNDLRKYTDWIFKWKPIFFLFIHNIKKDKERYIIILKVFSSEFTTHMSYFKPAQYSVDCVSVNIILAN